MQLDKKVVALLDLFHFEMIFYLCVLTVYEHFVSNS